MIKPSHPISELEAALNSYFIEQGFQIVSTTDIDSIHNNFDVLNVHSMFDARAYDDIFFINDTQILKKHNTGFEYKSLKQFGAPLRLAFLGRSYRKIKETKKYDVITFQYEGIIADKDITFIKGKKMIDDIMSGFLPSLKLRSISKFFPYAEPGYMVQIPCTLCGGKGCEDCLSTGYVNGCAYGMLHREIVDSALGENSHIKAFSFCFNLSQIACAKYNIDDIHKILLK